MMFENPVPIDGKIDHDDHVDYAHRKKSDHGRVEQFGTRWQQRRTGREVPRQFIQLNGNEEGGFADGQPDGPVRPKGEPQARAKNDEAVKKGTHLSHPHVRRGDLVEIVTNVRKEFLRRSLTQSSYCYRHPGLHCQRQRQPHASFVKKIGSE